MFGFFRRRRRRRIIAQPFPAEWQAMLHRDVGLYRALDQGERSKLRDDLRVFIEEKNWEAAHGFELTEQIKLIVAANACMLTLAMHGDPLRHARTIIIQPEAYVPPEPRMTGNIASEGFRASGTAYLHGPVVLSWQDLRRQSRNPNDGKNVILHEFAHKLDMTGGVIDGTPPLPSRAHAETWKRVMTAEFEQLQRAAQHGAFTLIDHYGATNPAEFFAVITECFFERPIELREQHTELYNALRSYFRQDTARRAEG